MFNGVPQEQFHQFIASSRTISSFPINPLSFPLHASTPNTTFPSSTSTFDPYPSHLLHQLHQQPVSLNKDEEEKDQEATNSAVLPEQIVDPWSNDEVLSLLRIRSSMENWFPDLTWEHVSRKLAEFGFKRSAEKCKEKFEEETRNLNSISFNKNRFFSELEELYHGEKTQKQNQDEEEDPATNATLVANNDNPSELQSEEVVKNTTSTKTNNKKRKREKKFEMFKGFCIDIVNKMMAQQEQMHNKLLEDMVNRDEEKIAREEAWKKKEVESFNKEIEIRAYEQAIASGRQATIIELLKQFATYSSDKHFGTSLSYENFLEISNNLSSSNPTSTSTKPLVSSQNQNLSNFEKNPAPIPPSRTQKAQKNHNPATNEKDDIGKRWPKDEVLALINMRCSLYNNINDHQDKEGVMGGAKGSLWENISQGMMELGYKRSAKRCKEKWENINKYFRKTKDVNKKRSVDSRTCPYFHQLNSLYNQGTLVAPDGPENRSALPKTDTAVSETTFGSAQQVTVDGGKNVTQVPAFNFEF